MWGEHKKHIKIPNPHADFKCKHFAKFHEWEEEEEKRHSERIKTRNWKWRNKFNLYGGKSKIVKKVGWERRKDWKFST